MQARDTFLSIASHELRTPLTSMTIESEMMKRSLAKQDPAALSLDRVTAMVTRTHEGLNRMIALFDDMLEVARIEGGKLSLRREPTEVFSFVQSVMNRYAEQLARAGIEWKVQSCISKVVFPMDRFRIEQVLANLIANAIRYAPHAPVALSLAAKEGQGFSLTFQDGGPGIAEENRERIFNRYERFISANEVSGLGLGLYIVREIIQAHGERIQLEMGPLKGARFVMQFTQDRARRPGWSRASSRFERSVCGASGSSDARHDR